MVNIRAKLRGFVKIFLRTAIFPALKANVPRVETRRKVLSAAAALFAQKQSAEAAVAAQTFAGKSVAGEAKAGLLTGVYEATEAPVGSYVLQNNEDKVGFYVVGSTIPTVGANRAYLTVPSTGVKAFFFDNATAIQGVEAEKENSAIFNLAGQRVNKAQKGIYIMNGKKVMVK